MTEHKCDFINSESVIQFGDQRVPFTLFRSTVNLICPVICMGATIIGPNEEAVLPCLLDATCQYDKGQPLLLEPRNTDKLEPFIITHVLINYNSKVVPVLLSNLTSKPMMILKNKVLADETPVTPCLYQESEFQPLTVAAAATAAGASRNELNPVEFAMTNADMALSLEQRSMLKSLLTKHKSVLSAGPVDMGRTNLIYHKIELEKSEPIRQGLRRVPHEHIGLLKNEVDKLQRIKAIKPSTSPFASPTILVKKKDSTMRLCIDYRKLNSVTKKDAHFLPRIEDIFDTLSGSKFFTTLDLAMEYHQVEVLPENREKTAFNTPFGLFQYNVMPFGLATAPATFMRLIMIVFSGMLYSTCLAYLDDIIIFGSTFEEQLDRLEQALKRLQNVNLKLKPSKCAFGKKSVAFLGHIISDQGITTDLEKVKRIQVWPPPRNENEVRGYLRYASYYRKFIRGFAHIVDPLNKLLQKNNSLRWSIECEDAFKTLKKAFLEVVTLAYPDFSKPFIVDTDACDVGIGAGHSQLNKSNVEQPLAYYSRSLSKPERKYAVTRKEMLALVDSLRHFRCYLIGKKVKLRTDHSALQWLRTFKEPVGQVARWIERFAEYDFEIVHRPGIRHANADALSRYPHPVSAVTVNEQWFSPNLKNEFLKHQEKDAITSTLINWLKKTSRPRADQMEGVGRELKYYWVRCDELAIEDGILGVRNPVEDGPDTQFCAIVPQAAKQEILELEHSSAAGGHFGVQKTIDKL